MKHVFTKMLWLFFLICLAMNEAMTLGQPTIKSRAKKQSSVRSAKTKIVTGTSVPGSITKEWALKTPKLLKDVQDKLLKGEGNDHDSPGILAEVGDISSVPALIALLKRNPVYPDGTMICTRSHCLQALSKLTGVNVGKTDEAWEKWWEDYKKTR